MFQYFLTNIILIALGVMLYLVVRTLPRLSEPERNRKVHIVERWMQSGIPQRVDMTLEVFSLKFLRKTKVALLKADNAVSKHLQKKAKQKDRPAGNAAIDFTEIHTNARSGSNNGSASSEE